MNMAARKYSLICRDEPSFHCNGNQSNRGLDYVCCFLLQKSVFIVCHKISSSQRTKLQTYRYSTCQAVEQYSEFRSDFVKCVFGCCTSIIAQCSMTLLLFAASEARNPMTRQDGRLIVVSVFHDESLLCYLFSLHVSVQQDKFSGRSSFSRHAMEQFVLQTENTQLWRTAPPRCWRGSVTVRLAAVPSFCFHRDSPRFPRRDPSYDTRKGEMTTVDSIDGDTENAFPSMSRCSFH